MIFCHEHDQEDNMEVAYDGLVPDDDIADGDDDDHVHDEKSLGCHSSLL